MKSINFLYFWTKTLFFCLGIIIFITVFMFKNNFYPNLSKFILVISDLPFLFIGSVYFILKQKIITEEYQEEFSSLSRNILPFLILVIFALIVFFHFTFPDLI
jgi:hypothetical protein